MDTVSLPKYTYSPLEKETQEIRLIKLLPGISNEPLHINLTATPLLLPQPKTLRRLSLVALRSTLPDGWEAHETLEGRYVFHCSQSDEVTWDHPDPDFDAELYDTEREIDDQKPSPCYEALSYVWGKPDKSHQVIVVDENAGSHAQLQITTNLYSALMHLRAQDRARTLWVDAVCINQEDLSERSEQVQRMAAIYAQAYKVVVWLGAEADDSKLALDCLRYIGEQGIVTKSNFGYRSPEAREPDWYLATCDIPYPSRVWNAVSQLLSRAWFERLWIFQEIQLANARSVFQCGFDEIAWPMFRSAVLCLKEKNQVFTPNITPLLRQVFPLCLEWRDESFPLMLNAILQRKCTDEKDFVYALLGLVPSKFAARIVPDYRLSCGEIYKGVFLEHLKYTSRLELLAFGGRGAELGAPSWTPNWLAKRQYRPNRGLASAMSPAAQQDLAAPNNPVTSPPSESRSVLAALAKCLLCGCVPSRPRSPPQSVYAEVDGAVLEVDAVKCGTIAHLGDVAEGELDARVRMARMWDIQCREWFRNSRYETGEPVSEAFSTTLLEGGVDDIYPEMMRGTAREWDEEWRAVCEGEELNNEQVLGNGNLFRCAQMINFSRFMATDARHMGLAPVEARIGNDYLDALYGSLRLTSKRWLGDGVFVLLGCGTPVVLRAAEGERWRVIGPCYAHGLMNGEALLGQFPAGWKGIFLMDEKGLDNPFFKKTSAENGQGEATDEDPRLSSVVTPFERIKSARTADDPICFTRFRDGARGVEINYDPRMTAQALRERGVDVKRLKLI